jgi:hypothetical protein
MRTSCIGWAAAALLCCAGCAERAIVLRSLTGDAPGREWVWPYFLEGQPVVLAFWTTDEMQCLRDVPALKALEAREGAVQLITVVVGRDRMEIDKWLREERIRYVILLDLEEKLAGRLRVDGYPTYVLFDAEGKEVSRAGDIRLARNWFDRERWLERTGAVRPASGPGAEGE